MLVQFPEPLNPKTEAVLAGNGIEIEEFSATQLSDDDINSSTIIFAMEETLRSKVLEGYEKANEDNTFTLSSYVGGELEIPNPYGGDLQLYGLCYEVLKDTLTKLIDLLKQER